MVRHGQAYRDDCTFVLLGGRRLRRVPTTWSSRGYAPPAALALGMSRGLSLPSLVQAYGAAGLMAMFPASDQQPGDVRVLAGRVVQVRGVDPSDDGEQLFADFAPIPFYSLFPDSAQRATLLLGTAESLR